MDVPEIGIEELDEAWSSGSFILDVREPDEVDSARLSGATTIALMDVPVRLADIPTDQAVYVICARGGRSMKAAGFLRARGIDAVNVAGGMVAWRESGRPVESGPTTG